MPTPSIFGIQDGKSTQLIPTTLHQLNKYEIDLENFITNNVECLELEAEITGIHGPYEVFRQNDFINAIERDITPDIVIFSASGHIIIVEVKLSTNQELKSRKVVAQIIDYASAFYNKTDSELLQFFSTKENNPDTWVEFIYKIFPHEQYIENLASQFQNRLSTGQIDMIVACDKAPLGVNSFLRGVSQQSALPFTLKLVEITPYVCDEKQSEPFLFLSKIVLKTEIVSRTVVNVFYSESEAGKPSVQVETTSIDEIEEQLNNQDERRPWTKEEIQEAFLTAGNEVISKLLEFALENSYNGQIHSPGKKLKPAFGLYVRGFTPEGKITIRQVFNYCHGALEITVYLNNIEYIIDADAYEVFFDSLAELFPTIDFKDKREPYIPLSKINNNIEDFKKLFFSLIAD